MDRAGRRQCSSGTFRGPDSVASGVFSIVPQQFDEFSCTVEAAEDCGDTVVITARFKGTNKSGAELDTAAEHVWEVRDGKVVRFENKVDQAAWSNGWS